MNPLLKYRRTLCIPLPPPRGLFLQLLTHNLVPRIPPSPIPPLVCKLRIPRITECEFCNQVSLRARNSLYPNISSVRRRLPLKKGGREGGGYS